MSSTERTAPTCPAGRGTRSTRSTCPDEGRVRSVTVDGRSIALTRCGGTLGALENHCPHQGGPLGEGSIEKGLLRCPWHGYDYDPLTGAPPGDLRRRGARLRDRGARRRRLGPAPRAGRGRAGPSADVLVETLVAHGVDTVFGMVGHSNLGFADALRRAEERGELTLHRHPARGRGRVRRQRLRQADRPTGRLLRHRRPGLDQPAHRAVRREAGPVPGDRDLRPGALQGARPRRLPGPRPLRGLPRRRDHLRRPCRPAATTPSSPRSR